jgi:hypothetical protein
MERFTQSIKDEYPELEGPEEIEVTLETLHGLKMPDCDGIGLSPVSKMPAKVLVLLQVGLRRTIEFTEAAIREINQRNLATSALLSRGTIETSCLLWEVMRHVESVADKGDPSGITDLDEILSKTLLGGKAKDWMLSEEIVARNVLTIIQKLTKQLGAPFEGFYAALSEYAHPNYHGMMATYTEFGLEGGIKIFTDRRTGGQRAILLAAIGALATSGSVVLESFKLLAKHLEPLAVLAERQIYEDGKWPADVEYPVKRA